MSKKRSLKLYLEDMRESAEAILEYIDSMPMEAFAQDRKTYSAVIREFEIIGEAVKHIPPEFVSRYPECPWRDIRDFRNLLAHEYFGVDLEIVWNTAHQELPPLIRFLKDVLKNNV